MLLETFDNTFEYQKLPKEEMEQRGILGRLVGVIADTKNPTRNGRAYSEKLWENVFKDPIMQEKIKNRCVFGELGHPTDRTETDMEKIAICLAEQPKKGSDGKLYGVFDILNTKCGRLLKTLCDYGCNIGISSRGEGDLVTDYAGNEAVDPDTYSCECWDAVLIPAVKEARLNYVTESLDKKRYNKTLRESLQKTLDSASEDERKIMKEALDSLNIKLNEESEITEEVIDEMASHFEIIIAVMDPTTGERITGYGVYDRAKAFDYILDHPEKSYDLVYERWVNGKFLDSKLLARRANLDDLKNYDKSDRKINIYVNDEWMPKNTDFETLLAAYKDPSKIVLVGIGTKLTEELDINEILESFNETSINDSQPEMDDINEAQNTAVDNNEAIVEELQEAIKAKAELEQKVVELQEQLSGCFATEAKTEELIAKDKDTIKRLAEGAKQAKALETKTTTLEQRLKESEQKNSELVKMLKESKEHETELKNLLVESKEKLKESLNKNVSLKENYSNKLTETQNQLNESMETVKKELADTRVQLDNTNKALKESLAKEENSVKEIKSLKESVEKEKAVLNENIAKLEKDIKLQKTEYSQKMTKAKQLIEKYQKATQSAVDRYISLQADRLGSSINEIKNRLPESYSFKDIDKVCEDLQDYNLNMSKLPFSVMSKSSLAEDIKIKGTSSRNESILPVNGFDDDVDADLMYLAGK